MYKAISLQGIIHNIYLVVSLFTFNTDCIMYMIVTRYLLVYNTLYNNVTTVFFGTNFMALLMFSGIDKTHPNFDNDKKVVLYDTKNSAVH